MRISDWSSDVCSSDLHAAQDQRQGDVVEHAAVGEQAMVLEHHAHVSPVQRDAPAAHLHQVALGEQHRAAAGPLGQMDQLEQGALAGAGMAGHEQHLARPDVETRSEEHTSELQSLMRISYAVFCLKKKTK